MVSAGPAWHLHSLLMRLLITAAEGPNPEGRVGTPSARGSRHEEVSISPLPLARDEKLSLGISLNPLMSRKFCMYYLMPRLANPRRVVVFRVLTSIPLVTSID